MILPLALRIPATLALHGEIWYAKEEFHVTLLNRTHTGRFGKEKIGRAAEGLHFEVRLRDEYWRLDEPPARTIIRMCDVAAAAVFYERLGLEPPPLHVTLYTINTRKGIGIATDDELRKMGTPLGSTIAR